MIPRRGLNRGFDVNGVTGVLLGVGAGLKVVVVAVKGSVKAGFEGGLGGDVHLSRLGIDRRAAAAAAVVGNGGRGRIVGGCREVAELAVVLIDDLADEGVDGHGDDEDDPKTIRILLGEEARMHIPDGPIEDRNAQDVPLNGDPAPELRKIVNSRRKHRDLRLTVADPKILPLSSVPANTKAMAGTKGTP